jgi:hypothetical protein
VTCLYFDPRTNERCNRFAGEGVFCNLAKHTESWEELTEEQQTEYNAMLTNPHVAYDRDSWTAVFNDYRAAKSRQGQALAASTVANLVAIGAEGVSAANKMQQESIERARQRVAGAWQVHRVVGAALTPLLLQLPARAHQRLVLRLCA